MIIRVNNTDNIKCAKSQIEHYLDGEGHIIDNGYYLNEKW